MWLQAGCIAQAGEAAMNAFLSLCPRLAHISWAQSAARDSWGAVSEQNPDLSLLPFPQSWADESLLIDLTDAALLITHYPALEQGLMGLGTKLCLLLSRQAHCSPGPGWMQEGILQL